MPRKHKPVVHIPYQQPKGEAGKNRYATKQAAEKAATERMLLHPTLELTVYRGLDGGWYLTRRSSGNH